MEQIKHECGVAMVRLLRPLSYYKEKYGTYAYALNKLYLLMEKQHNRGQEAAGLGVVKLQTVPGNEYIFRERAMGTNAITEIFDKIGPILKADHLEEMSPEEAETLAPFIGQINIGHLRYSTTGKSGISYVHPFLRRNNWKARNLLLCGNFNLTNVDEIFNNVVNQGQHPRIYGDTFMLLEQIGFELDREHHRVYRELRNSIEEPELSSRIEDEMDMSRVLNATAPQWDGGYVICGATGAGEMFALRDSNGIRPAFYYCDDEVVVVASERPVIQTVFNVACSAVKELTPGEAILVNKQGKITLKQILPQGRNKRCAFERIYFSRGSDKDIYHERKELGRQLAGQVYTALNQNLIDSVFSFIPNTAEVAFIGLVEGLNKILDRHKADKILALAASNDLSEESLVKIMKQKLRVEKIALKDIKLRTFIAEGNSRNDLAAHVYDVTYGIVKNHCDTLVVIDDSIVRGTTLRQSIIKMLDRLHPKRIIILSSSPQVRYPDCYGIDMSRMAEFIAFRAAVELLKEQGRGNLLQEVYLKCKDEATNSTVNHVKEIYAPFSDAEISKKIAEMLTPAETVAEVDIIYQSIEGLHTAIPNHPGDWYFTGDYPTPGGIRLVNRAFVNYYEGNETLR